MAATAAQLQRTRVAALQHVSHPHAGGGAGCPDHARQVAQHKFADVQARRLVKAGRVWCCANCTPEVRLGQRLFCTPKPGAARSARGARRRTLRVSCPWRVASRACERRRLAAPFTCPGASRAAAAHANCVACLPQELPWPRTERKRSWRSLEAARPLYRPRNCVVSLTWRSHAPLAPQALHAVAQSVAARGGRRGMSAMRAAAPQPAVALGCATPQRSRALASAYRACRATPHSTPLRRAAALPSRPPRAAAAAARASASRSVVVTREHGKNGPLVKRLEALGIQVRALRCTPAPKRHVAAGARGASLPCRYLRRVDAARRARRAPPRASASSCP